ncbi:hypothetical protein [Winogradskyella luteola]|uniref:Uncharacterized protein n=1 Tax=Winogradskyella luteola TaxID=2828330 RepID=A0A9X1F549_9FLAO|nr:hypothetical protein [Winogradskyella luteola]MBV7267582.1 hypothetical protein [Winogradskyella luteola]
MLRDYVCSLCTNRYSYIPPDGCSCSEHKTTVYYDGAETKRLQEKEERERQLRQEQINKEKREAEARARASQKSKPKSKPANNSSSSSGIGPALGFIVFLIVAGYLYFALEEHYAVALGTGAVLGIIIRYTYKLILLIIFAAVGYYIYKEYFEKDHTATAILIEQNTINKSDISSLADSSNFYI